MADNLKKVPKKGILKNSSSFETVEREKELSKETKWDEMNIIATFHPKDKDYGHMKIEEPKTPYSFVDASGDDHGGIDADLLAESISLDNGFSYEINKTRRCGLGRDRHEPIQAHALRPDLDQFIMEDQNVSGEEDFPVTPRHGFQAEMIKLEGHQLPSAITEPDEESSEEDESPEDKEKRKVFEMKRKQHYNEYAAVKLARKLMEEDDDDQANNKIPEESEFEHEDNEIDKNNYKIDSESS